MNSAQDKKRKKRVPSSHRKKKTSFSVVIAIVIGIVAGIFIAPYFSHYLQDKQTDGKPKQIQPPIPEKKEEIPHVVVDDQLGLQETKVESLGEEENVIEKQDVAETSCEEITESIISFYNHLDKQMYIRDAKLESKSGIYFTSLIQKLLDNPPVVTRETDDLYTILQNTAHFFRVIGKKNILIIKGILHNEKNLFENILVNYYNLTEKKDCSIKTLPLTFPENSLYDYAGFFLNTMGGRLYLFRRDSHSRMVISYYALLTIDQANQNGNNRYGIDINQPIDSLINEIETSGAHLKLREQYLDKLYELKERYQ